MRIGIANFSHESNTFAADPTPLNAFHIYRGQAVIDHYTPTFHEVAGYIAGAQEYDFELAPLFSANATPAGPLTLEAYETLVGTLLNSIRAAQPLDGLLLALHGAMVAKAYAHADGETVRRVRELVGPDFPFVVTHDYHGNVPPQLVADADGLIIDINNT